MLATRWTENFTISDEELDYLVNVLLERETPMTTRELAHLLIETRLQKAQDLLTKQYKDTQVYIPAKQYDVGTRLVFTEMALATATVTAVRSGNNETYGAFDVIAVKFDEANHNIGANPREFAANLATEHILNTVIEENPLTTNSDIDIDETLEANNAHILRTTLAALKEHSALERVAGFWFPRELVMDCDMGVMHLSEAVLDMAGGGPLAPEDIIEQIGGLGDAPLKLQVFSLNFALNNDDRFDEVGSLGQVMWFLNRMEPEAVREIPELLQYTPIEYDDDLLSDEIFDLETELDDEHTPIEFEGRLPKATSALIYPHRQLGTLPLNAKTRTVFPVARTPRIHVELVDETDGETFSGWVVHNHKYVFGLLDYYTKHSLPIGADISVKLGEEESQIIVSHEAYNPRTEWIRILTPKNNQITFEQKKRAIGAEYDELMIIGVDDIEAVNKLAKTYKDKTIVSILRELITELAKLSPQGTVHAVTLYSAVNVIRRCAPGPIFALLTANPDFEDVGNHYWKLNTT
ncbi:MAG: hypothetical protein Q9P44_10450 [Anaerolineae bacterium]|nr:hypothetical protein [Anaerolineae bacterium]